MPSKSKSDADLQNVKQAIEDMHRKFRVLENDKRAYSEDSQSVIRKQRSSVEKLTRENRKMKQELTEMRAANAAQGEHKIGITKLQKISEEKETCDRQLRVLVSKRDKLQEQFDSVSENIAHVRRILAERGGINSTKETQDQLNKQITVLENRLDRGLQQFNEAVAQNHNLRQQIDSLRKERVVFDGIYRKLKQELTTKKMEMANIIEQANAAYEARDQAQSQMAGLKQQADKEHTEFEREWIELGKLIENDKKMKEFMRQKEQQRLVTEEVTGATKGGDGDLTDAQEKALEKKVSSSAWKIAHGKAGIQMSVEKVKTYEEAFAKIQAATGISDINELVKTFINAEDQNFSFYNFANILSEQIEGLEGEIQRMKNEIDDLTTEPTGEAAEAATDFAKSKRMDAMEETLRVLEQKSLRYDGMFNKANQILTTGGTVRNTIQSIFTGLGCAAPDTVEGLIHSSVTPVNMCQYLQVIEDRVEEVLKLYHAANNDEDDEDDRPRDKQVTQPNAMRLPSTVDDQSDQDDVDAEEDQRPYTRDELKLHSLRQIKRKQAKQQKMQARHNK